MINLNMAASKHVKTDIRRDWAMTRPINIRQKVLSLYYNIISVAWYTLASHFVCRKIDLKILCL